MNKMLKVMIYYLTWSVMTPSYMMTIGALMVYPRMTPPEPLVSVLSLSRCPILSSSFAFLSHHPHALSCPSVRWVLVYLIFPFLTPALRDTSWHHLWYPTILVIPITNHPKSSVSLSWDNHHCPLLRLISSSPSKMHPHQKKFSCFITSLIAYRDVLGSCLW